MILPGWMSDALVKITELAAGLDCRWAVCGSAGLRLRGIPYKEPLDLDLMVECGEPDQEKIKQWAIDSGYDVHWVIGPKGLLAIHCYVEPRKLIDIFFDPTSTVDVIDGMPVVSLAIARKYAGLYADLNVHHEKFERQVEALEGIA